MIAFVDAVQILTPLVSVGIAVGVYLDQKRKEVADAAATVLIDIRRAEEIKSRILDKSQIDKEMKMVIVDNSWGRYRHLLARHLNQVEFELASEFFDCCAELSEARLRLLAVFDASLTAKAEKTQQLLLDISAGSDVAYGYRRAEIINRANEENWLFDPNEPKLRIINAVNKKKQISGTTLGEKLNALSGWGGNVPFYRKIFGRN